MPGDISDKLRIVRRYTGNKFSAGRGYDARKSLSRARMRTIDKYFNLISELTSVPHVVIDPPKGGKREAFEFTGQRHHPRFAKAIVKVPDATQKYDFNLDRSRPKGSRFVMTNRRTGERMWHIPAEVFVYEDPELFEEYHELQAEFFTDVIEEYGEDGEVYVIQNGSYQMWGAAGTPESVGEKLAELFKSYGAGNFDAYNKNSHFIGNWFRGVQVYADARDFEPVLSERFQAFQKRVQERHLSQPWQKIRVLKSGDIGIFDRGHLTQTIRTQDIQPLKGRKKKSKSRGRGKRG